MRPKVPRETKTSKALPIPNSNVAGDKSFADDLNKERGIVSCPPRPPTELVCFLLVQGRRWVLSNHCPFRGFHRQQKFPSGIVTSKCCSEFLRKGQIRRVFF